MAPDGAPVVTERNATDLSIKQPLQGGGTFAILCQETKVAFTGVDGHGHPLPWAWDMIGGTQQKSAVPAVTPQRVLYRCPGASYQLRVPPGAGSCRQLGNDAIRLSPNDAGKLVLTLGGILPER
jgi:hypothetical protein